MFDRLGAVIKRVITLAGIIALLCCLVYFVIYTPLRSYAELADNIEQAGECLHQNLNLISTYEQEQENLHSARKRLAGLETLFAGDMQDGMALAFLGQQARSQNVAVTFFQPLSVLDKGDYREMPLQLGVRGTYSDVVEYLAWVEDTHNPLNLCQLREITIEPYAPGNGEGRKKETGKVIAKCRLVIYMHKTAEKELQLDEPLSIKVGRLDVFREPFTGKNAPKSVSSVVYSGPGESTRLPAKNRK